MVLIANLVMMLMAFFCVVSVAPDSLVCIAT